MEEENEFGRISNQKQSLLFPSVTCYGSIPQNSQNITEVHHDWLTNSSYDSAALDNNSVIISKDVSKDGEPLNKGFENIIHGDQGEPSTNHSCESVLVDNNEVDILRHHKKKEKRKKHKHKQKERNEAKKLICGNGKVLEDLVSKPDTLWIDDVNLPPSEAFRFSTKPDLDNRMYNTLYRLDVALYKVKPSVMCIGLNKHQASQFFEQKNRGKRKIQEVIRYWNNKDWTSEPETINVKNRKISDNLCSRNYSYVPVELPEKAPNVENNKNMEISGCDDITAGVEDSISQRIEDFNRKLRENPHNVDMWMDFIKFQEEAILKGEALKVHLSDTKNEQRKKVSALVTDKKIAIFEKALEHNPDSLELMAAHLKLSNSTLTPEKLLEKWKKIIFIHPNKTELWKEYIHFAQSNFSLFCFDKVVSIYHKCLETLSSVKEGTFASHKPGGNIESDMLDIFVQLCHFMRQSGHTEKAFSSFQALIEFTCLCPQNLEKNVPLKKKVDFLEIFWDSGVPRFGEDSATGWKNWMNSSLLNETSSSLCAIDMTQLFKSTGDEVDVDSDEENDESNMMYRNMPQWQAWLKVETVREKSHWKPWQPDKDAGETEEDCEDPERLVLFDDISPSLFNISSLENRFQLILHFLIFMGVPLPLTVSTASSETISYLHTCLEDKQQILKMVHGQRLGLWRTCIWTSNLLESENETKSGTHVWPPQQLIHSVRNVFAQCLGLFEGNYKSFLMSVWIWYEMVFWQKENQPKKKKMILKDVRKLAKSFLKLPSNRNDLLVWQTYAEIEWIAGNVSEARRILNSTLAMSWDLMSHNGIARSTVTSLFRFYAELEIGLHGLEYPAFQSRDVRSCYNRALHILASFAEGEQFQPFGNDEVPALSPVRILKTQKQFDQLITHVIHDYQNEQLEDDSFLQASGDGVGIGSLLVHLVACNLMFHYLTSGIKEMCLAFDQILLEVSNVKPSPGSRKALDIELIWTVYIRLLRYHSERHAMPLKDVRNILLAGLSNFPENPEFLSFYVQLEARSNISGNVRRFFDRNIRAATSPVPWILSVCYEQNRSETVQPVVECSLEMDGVQGISQSDLCHLYCTTLPITGITHRQRALFDKSSTHPSGQRCIALWRMYIQFETKYGSRERAKAVFYQALQHCPWAKVLYLDAVRYLPDELQSVIDLMEEKGVRVRVPLEELQLMME